MIAWTLAALFTVVAIATGLSFIDSWIRGRVEFRALLRTRALLEAGFVPQVETSEVRLRNPARRTLASVNRRGTRRVPLALMQQAG